MRQTGDHRLTRWLLMCGAVGGFGFIAVFLIAGALRPGYSPLYQPVSSLSLGPTGWVQVTNFVVTGLLMPPFAYGLHRARPETGLVWAPRLIAMFGAGLVLAGVFPTDPGFGYPAGAPAGMTGSTSWHGVLHNVASLVVFVVLTMACFVFGRRSWTSGDRRWAIYSFITAIAVPVFFVAASIGWTLGTVGGLLQRISIAAGWVWLSVLALRCRESFTASRASSRLARR
jgi:hypothetical membrane protein